MNVIDRIYEAAVVPDSWNDALGAMAAAARAQEASMLLFIKDGPVRAIEHNVPAGQISDFAGVWQTSPAVRWALDACPGAFTRFADHVPAEQLANDPAMRMLYDRGIVDEIITVHALDATRKLGFIFPHQAAAGRCTAADIAALDALRPHLIRAGTVAARLELERAQAMTSALAQLGLAAAVVNRTGRVLASNALLDSLGALVVPAAFGRLALRDRTRNAQLREILARAGTGATGPAASLPIPGTDAHPPMIIHLLPVRGQGHDIFVGGHVVVVFSPVARRQAPQPSILSALFDLTPAEGRLLNELVVGGTLPEIAVRLGVSVHTVRAQLRAVAAKTGVQRQSEMVQLVAGL